MARIKKLRPPRAYCGRQPGTTRDHVIPQCLFTPPLPGNMITVRACQDCHDAKSRNDDYLRDLLTFERDCSDHPVAQELMNSKVIGSMERSSSQFARELVRTSEPVLLQTPGGIIFEQAYRVPVDTARINQIMETIARGIFCRIVGRRIPDGYRFDVRQVRRWAADMMIEEYQRIGVQGPFFLRDVFGFMFGRADEGRSVLFMWFYEAFFILVHSRPESERSPLDEARAG